MPVYVGYVFMTKIFFFVFLCLLMCMPVRVGTLLMVSCSIVLTGYDVIRILCFNICSLKQLVRLLLLWYSGIEDSYMRLHPTKNYTKSYHQKSTLTVCMFFFGFGVCTCVCMPMHTHMYACLCMYICMCVSGCMLDVQMIYEKYYGEK